MNTNSKGAEILFTTIVGCVLIITVSAFAGWIKVQWVTGGGSGFSIAIVNPQFTQVLGFFVGTAVWKTFASFAGIGSNQ